MGKGIQLDCQKLNTVDPALLVNSTSPFPPVLTEQPSEQPYTSTTTSPTAWTISSFNSLVTLGDEGIVTKTNLAVKEGKYREVYDFSDHLDDVRRDWLGNPAVVVD